MIWNVVPNTHLHTTVILCPGGLHRLEHEPADEFKLDGQPCAALKQRSGQKASLGEEVVGPVDIAGDEDILPGDEGMIEYKNGIVLVESARKGVVERRAHYSRRILVGSARNQFDARRIHRYHKDHGIVPVLYRNQPVMGDKRSMRERRTGSDNLGTADVHASVCLFLNVDAHLGSLVDSTITINRWVDDSVVEIHHPLLRFFVPSPCIRFEGPVKLRVRAQCAEERCLVIRRAAQPAICQATPGSTGITRSKLLFAAFWGFEIFVCAAARSGVRLRSQDIL